MAQVKNKPEEKLEVETVDLSAVRGAVLSMGDLAELSSILGNNIRTPMELIEQCRKLTTVKTEGVEIALEPGLLQRLKSRCPKGVTFNVFLSDQVKRWAHSFVGW